MRRKRILLVIAGLGAGGAERQMVLLAKGLDRNLYEVGVLIFNEEQKVHYRDLFSSEIWFRALGLSRKRAGILSLMFYLILGLRKAVRDFQPDIIHSSLHVANVAVRVSRLLFFQQIHVITSIRCNFLLLYPRFDQYIEKLLSNQSSMIIVNSDVTRRQLERKLNVQEGSVVTIENGVDPVYCPGLAPRPREWPVFTQRICLVVGRFTKEKNHLELINALKVLDSRGQLQDWHFILVGEGLLSEKIEAAIAGLARIQVVAPVADILRFYRNADLLLLPSLHEGMSNVALEAQACGVPVAITASANASGVVAPECGWILNDDLVSSIASVLVATSTAMKLRGSSAMNVVRERFGVESMIAKTQSIYDRVLGEFSSP
jgi:glycosyltransferase involved in cell wall biosynthesis